MSRFLGNLIYPTVTALPAGVAGQFVMYQKRPWYFDGTTWIRQGVPPSQTVFGRALVSAGNIPTPEITATWTETSANTSSVVSGWISYVAPATKDADEMEMDVIDVWCRANAGSIDIRLTGQTGMIAGDFNVDYIIVKGA